METCGDNCKCGADDELYSYPESIREKFCESRGYTFEDGRHVSAAEMWRFMTEEAPARFPYNFVDTRSCEAISHDSGFFTGIKRNYLNFTSWDRMKERIKSGKPAVTIQFGHPCEPYRAAGCEPVGPGFGRHVAVGDRSKGQGLRESEQRMVDLMEEYKKSLPAESCNLIASYPASSNEDSAPQHERAMPRHAMLRHSFRHGIMPR